MVQRDPDVGADPQPTGHRQAVHHRIGLRVGNDLREFAIRDQPAVAADRRFDGPGADRQLYRADQVAELPLISLESVDEGHLHTQLGRDQLEHRINGVPGVRGRRRGGPRTGGLGRLNHVAGAVALLVLVHESIGLAPGLDQATDGRTLRDSGRGGHPDRGQAGQDLLGQAHPLLLRGVRQQQPELVTAQARDDIAAAQSSGQFLRGPDDELVPGLVPLFIVDLLQTVEINDDDGRGGGEGGGSRFFPGHRHVPGPPVPDPGEHVLMGHLLDAFGLTHLLGEAQLVRQHDPQNLRLPMDHPHALGQPGARGVGQTADRREYLTVRCRNRNDGTGTSLDVVSLHDLEHSRNLVNVLNARGDEAVQREGAQAPPPGADIARGNAGLPVQRRQDHLVLAVTSGDVPVLQAHPLAQVLQNQRGGGPETGDVRRRRVHGCSGSHPSRPPARSSSQAHGKPGDSA
jgi:hypothetical protein